MAWSWGTDDATEEEAIVLKTFFAVSIASVTKWVVDFGWKRKPDGQMWRLLQRDVLCCVETGKGSQTMELSPHCSGILGAVKIVESMSNREFPVTEWVLSVQCFSSAGVNTKWWLLNHE